MTQVRLFSAIENMNLAGFLASIIELQKRKECKRVGPTVSHLKAVHTMRISGAGSSAFKYRRETPPKLDAPALAAFKARAAALAPKYQTEF